MKYPPKKVKKKSFLETIQPEFIPISSSSQKEEITAIRQLRQASNSLVQELWEAGRDLVSTCHIAFHNTYRIQLLHLLSQFNNPLEILLRNCRV